MNKREQRKEIKEIFENKKLEAGSVISKVITEYNKSLNAVTVKFYDNIITSSKIARLIQKGYIRFTVASKDWGIRLNIYYKD